MNESIFKIEFLYFNISFIFCLLFAIFLFVFSYTGRTVSKDHSKELRLLSVSLTASAAGNLFLSLINIFQIDFNIIRQLCQFTNIMTYIAFIFFFNYCIMLGLYKKKQVIIQLIASTTLLIAVSAASFFTPYFIVGQPVYLKGFFGKIVITALGTYQAFFISVLLFIIIIFKLYFLLKLKNNIDQKRIVKISIIILLIFLILEIINKLALFRFFLFEYSLLTGLMFSSSVFGIRTMFYLLRIKKENIEILNKADEINKSYLEAFQKIKGIIPFISEYFSDRNRMNKSLESELEIQERSFQDISFNISEAVNGSERLDQLIGEYEKLLNNFSTGVEIQNKDIVSLQDVWKDLSVEVNSIAKNSSEIAQNIHYLISNIEDGKALIDSNLKVLKIIQKSTEKVYFIVDIINEISDETKMLSINAAIEAFHAGIKGKGFSVLAEEIRNIANLTFNEAQSIADSINDIIMKSKEIENIIKGIEMIFTDFSKSIEGLYVYILNTINTTSELSKTLDSLLKVWNSPGFKSNYSFRDDEEKKKRLLIDKIPFIHSFLSEYSEKIDMIKIDFTKVNEKYHES